VHFVAKPGRFGHKLTDMIFVDYCGCIPADMPNGEIFKTVKKRLNRGIVAIFPEGHYTRDGKIHPFKKGIGRMALESNVPVLPIALKGTYSICPGPKLIPKLKKKVEVRIGKPMKFNLSKSEKNYRKVALEVEKEVKRLFKS